MSFDANFNLAKAISVTCPVSFIRKMLIGLAMISSSLAPPVALAQDQTTKHHGGVMMASSDEQEFVVDSELAVSKMNLEMSVDPAGDVDRDFIAMMIPHAQGAIDVARAELKYGHSEDLRRLARSIIAGRESEMSDMRGGIGCLSRTPAKRGY
jgi:uncharacterized protein (DUF305 family)